MKPLQLPFGSLTGDMISPPLSPNSDLNFNTITPAVRSALEYLSSKLECKHVHLTLIVSRDKPLPVGQGCKLQTYTISKLEESSRRAFNRYSVRAAKKHGLQPGWMATLHSSCSQDAVSNPSWDYTLHRSILQNDVLFSQEGLTLLNIDRSKPSTDHIPDNIYMDACLWLLRQLLRETGGRPFTKGFFHCAYDHLQVRDDLLVRLANEYAFKYDHDAIILPKPKAVPKPRIAATSPLKRSVAGRHRRSGSASARMAAAKRQVSGGRIGPKTPLSASDVTPITKNEWNMLMEIALGGIKLVPVQGTFFDD
jgi:hypothetical protein